MGTAIQGAIDHEIFFLDLGWWVTGGRECQATVSKHTVLHGTVKAINPAKSQLTLLCDSVPITLDLSAADNFYYLDYNDPDKQMAEYFEAGFPAWMRAYEEGELLMSLLLKND